MSSSTAGNRIAVINAHGTTRLRHEPFCRDVDAVLRSVQIADAEVRIVFVDEGELLRLNRTFLDHHHHTDVITFPLEEDPLEGEIYISVEMVRRQAGEYGVSFYEEARRLAIHGALHLIGKDDRTDSQRAEMRRLEDRFLHGS